MDSGFDCFGFGSIRFGEGFLDWIYRALFDVSWRILIFVLFCYERFDDAKNGICSRFHIVEGFEDGFDVIGLSLCPASDVGEGCVSDIYA